MMRKRIILMTAVIEVLSLSSLAQTNTFPSSGNVGIGTTDPANKLSFGNVIEDTSDGITWYDGAPTIYGIHRTPGIWVGPNYQQLRVGWETGIVLDPGSLYGRSYVDIKGNGLRITGGSVGIGTTNPGNKLSFGNVLNNTTDGITWYDGDPTVYGIHRTPGSWTGPDYQQLRVSWETGIVLDPGSLYGRSYVDIKGSGLRISTGSVGIGTTDTQDYKLAVAGNMIAESVKVKLHGSWPDYVFEPDYKIPDLKETEQFIKKHKHLPEIPSAAEVEEEGISLGEMNAKLLQKIEELTLHLIRKEDELQAERKINVRQEERLNALEDQLKYSRCSSRRKNP